MRILRVVFGLVAVAAVTASCVVVSDPYPSPYYTRNFAGPQYHAGYSYSGPYYHSPGPYYTRHSYYRSSSSWVAAP